MKKRLTTKSREASCDLFRGSASSPYNEIGTHLVLIRWITTSFVFVFICQLHAVHRKLCMQDRASQFYKSLQAYAATIYSSAYERRMKDGMGSNTAVTQ